MYNIKHNFHEELRNILYHYTIANQHLKTIEEMSELTKELCKQRIEKTIDHREQIVEEIADVLITVLQMVEVYGYTAVMNKVDFKINRTLDKIKKEREEEDVKGN